MSNCLQLDHVDYAYGAAKIRVLSEVSADFESGKMYAITGPSGAGKRQRTRTGFDGELCDDPHLVDAEGQKRAYLMDA